MVEDPLSDAGRDPEDEYRISQEARHALEDFESNTLDPMRGVFARLIYLASLRDYNTGRYHHYGLETLHSIEAVDRALRKCHTRVFEELMALPLEDQTRDLLNFFESLREDRARLINAWQRLRSYQVLPPEDCPPLARELFEKNIEVTLKVLRETDLWALLHEPHSHADHLP